MALKRSSVRFRLAPPLPEIIGNSGDTEGLSTPLPGFLSTPKSDEKSRANKCSALRVRQVWSLTNRSTCAIMSLASESFEACDVAVGGLVPNVGKPHDLLLDHRVVNTSLRQIGVHPVQLHRPPVRCFDRDTVVYAKRPERRLKYHTGNDCCCAGVTGREQFSGLFNSSSKSSAWTRLRMDLR
jgi:hypothetical protein